MDISVKQVAFVIKVQGWFRRIRSYRDIRNKLQPILRETVSEIKAFIAQYDAANSLETCQKAILNEKMLKFLGDVWKCLAPTASPAVEDKRESLIVRKKLGSAFVIAKYPDEVLGEGGQGKLCLHMARHVVACIRSLLTTAELDRQTQAQKRTTIEKIRSILSQYLEAFDAWKAADSASVAEGLEAALAQAYLTLLHVRQATTQEGQQANAELLRSAELQVQRMEGVLER
eukprot:gene42090-51387_t